MFTIVLCFKIRCSSWCPAAPQETWTISPPKAKHTNPLGHKALYKIKWQCIFMLAQAKHLVHSENTYLSSSSHFHIFDWQSQAVFLGAASHSQGWVRRTCPSWTYHLQTWRDPCLVICWANTTIFKHLLSQTTPKTRARTPPWCAYSAMCCLYFKHTELPFLTPHLRQLLTTPQWHILNCYSNLMQSYTWKW